MALWLAPDFGASLNGFSYSRVFEIPTPLWTCTREDADHPFALGEIEIEVVQGASPFCTPFQLGAMLGDRRLKGNSKYLGKDEFVTH